MTSRAIGTTLACLLLGTGCMIGPYDGQRVGETDDPIPVSGYHYNPGAAVQVQAYDFSARRWETLESSRSVSRSSLEFDGRPLYGWQLPEGITLDEPRFWENGWRGSHARVRTLWGWSSPIDPAAEIDEPENGAMLAVRQDYLDCAGEHTTIEAFRRHCAADDDTWADIYTRDWCAREIYEPSAQAAAIKRSRADYTTYLHLDLQGQDLPSGLNVEVPGWGTRWLSGNCLDGNRRCIYTWNFFPNRVGDDMFCPLARALDAAEAVHVSGQLGSRTNCSRPYQATIPLDYTATARCRSGSSSGGSGPNLVPRIAPHDGLEARVEVCNVGNVVARGGYELEVSGSLELPEDWDRVRSTADVLPGACASFRPFGVFRPTSSGPQPSPTVTATVYTPDILESNELDNSTSRNRE